MQIYELLFNPDIYQTLYFVRPDIVLPSWNYEDWFTGKSMIEHWHPIEVNFESEARKIPGDFPSIGGLPPVFSHKAIAVLGQLINESVEILSLKPFSLNLYAVNVTQVIDCLDESKSKIKRFSDGGIMRIEKYIFHDNCIGHANIFKIPQQLRGRIYVSHTFKMAVEENNLKGLIFHLVS